MKKFLPIIVSLFFFNCKPQPEIGLITEKAMVVSARAEASKIGSDILKKGGNAFDAMVATELALAVAYPYAGNIGGGGFMVYRKNNGEIGALDYREKAPLSATKNMFLDSLGNVIENKSTLGAMAVGVPGTVAGVFASHKKFGSLPIEDILQPVIELAKKGVVVTEKQQKRLEKHTPNFRKANKETILLDNNWKKGDSIRYISLAETLTRIQKYGRDEFYKGQTAKTLAKFLQDNGGIITEQDLAKYEAKWRTPVVFTYDDLKIISMAPPSSGGVCLAQIMNAIEPFNIEQYEHNSTKYIQLLVEAERRAYADRSHFLGDPDFVKIPMEELISKKYANSRMENFSFERPTLSSEISHGEINFIESDETTHYSIVDQFGNAVSVTSTLNGAYGSKLYCSELGFLLNNEMDDFSSKPGTPNMFGLIGAEANKIEPEKRMLSSMTPTIVEKNGKLFMVVGTPGGSTIITSVLQTILNVHEYNMGMQEAVNKPRFHHQWLPDEIRMEPNSFTIIVKEQLKKLGYIIDETDSPVIGKVDAILVLPNGKLEGGADHRGDDAPSGF
ncbi:gamma-glutamyltranspeptidase/glutathione hydrolase [Tenacibaculum skagerrakense]|uniref:Glutathione hydrolase proenzyme n=1 Tax=Tenacibaculum skagerrakense TaxID=186571 RepID=A0A4R2NRN3_9FLAO|nr:gamma-glutamyltransferase [Tenacibaculum skagerrakense]TCP24599.1 gamma-glutamyltranspeptidase/glutathione hydrolase [Tenacibaculum skagerrakense]